MESKGNKVKLMWKDFLKENVSILLGEPRKENVSTFYPFPWDGGIIFYEVLD